MILFSRRFCAGLLLSALGAGILILVGCSPQSREARFLKRGSQFMEKKDYARALLEFRNAEREMPQDAEPEFQMGLAYLGIGNKAEAFAAFTKAVALNPKHADAQIRLTELAASTNSRKLLNQAEEWAKTALTLSPDNADALTALGVAEMKLGKEAEAEEALKQALMKSPEHVRSSLALAVIRLSQKDVAGAEEILRKAVAQAPKSPEPLVAISQVYVMLGKAPEAEQALAKALAVDPSNSEALLYLARLQSTVGKTELAEQTYRRLSALPDTRFRTFHSIYLVQIGRVQQGIAELEKLYHQDPADRLARGYLVRSYMHVRRLADAQKLLSGVLQDNSKDVDAMMQRAEIEMMAGNLEQAAQDLHEVVSEKPDSAEAHYLLSRVDRGSGDSRGERQELAETLRINPKLTSVRVQLARLHTLGNHPGDALNLLDQAPDSEKAALPLIVERNWALLAQSNYADAARGIDQGLRLANLRDLVMQDAILKSSRRDISAARSDLEEILKKNPEDIAALELLTRTYSDQNQPKIALEKIRACISQRPKSGPLRLLLGQSLLAQNQADQARAAFVAAKANDPLLTAADLALAKMDRAAGRNYAVRQTLSGVFASKTVDRRNLLAAHLLMGDLENASGNWQAALDHWRKAIEIDPNNLIALNNAAFILLESGHQPDEALKYAQQALELAPNNPEIEDTIGWVYYRKGIYRTALDHLQHAVAEDGNKNDPPSTARRYHLGMAYLKAGSRERGVAIISAALKLAPNTPEARLAQSAIAESR